VIGWHENGRKKAEVTYKNGQIDGLCTEWDVNGKKKSETTFKDGKTAKILFAN
jgi:antitoxin component YwqK of YwqJK toxin-antitoxin module